jgi:hypothetical protein
MKIFVVRVLRICDIAPRLGAKYDPTYLRNIRFPIMAYLFLHVLLFTLLPFKKSRQLTHHIAVHFSLLQFV